MIEILAVLSVSAAAGMRIALPLLVMGLIQADLWQQVPPTQLVWILGVVGGLLALVLQLVKVGWFYRLQGLPTWAVLLEDILCVLLVLFAFKAPNSGGLIAMLLLWLAIRSSQSWYQWYKGGQVRN